MVKDISIEIIYPTANTKHTGFVARTLQLALKEGAESFPNIKSHALGTRRGVPQPLLGATNAMGYVALRDGGSKTLDSAEKKNIIIRLSHSQLVQIGMNTANIGIEDPNPLFRTLTRN